MGEAGHKGTVVVAESGWRRRRRRYLVFLLILFALVFVALNVGAAVHAWKLSRVVDYGDKRPVPEEMSVWDRMVFAVAGGYSPKSRLRAKPTFPYNDFTMKGSAGVLHGWESADPFTTATMLMCHGHGASRSSVLPEATAFREMGFRVVMFDFRAHGKSTGDVCSVGYFEAEDVKAAWDYVAEKYPGDEIYIYGISMGAVAASRAVAMYDLKAEGMILEMPFDRLLDAVRGRVRLMKVPAEPASTLLTFWGGIQNGFWAFGHRTADYVSELECPILVQWGSGDTRVSEAEIRAIQAAGKDCTVEVEIYPEVGHRSILKAAEDKWKQNVVDWLKTANRKTTMLR